MKTFTLKRHSDGYVYTFDRVGRHSYVRRDNPEMRIDWEGPWGWLARLPKSGVVAGRPWEILPQHQRETAPPEGIWISRKGGRSYVYDLSSAD